MQDEASATVAEAGDRELAAEARLAREVLTAPRRDSNSTLMLLLVVGFVVVALRDSSARDTIVLIGVLLFHETGHLVSMRLFGFTDLRMFFLPGFGAAASGHKPGASAVEHAIVSLAGPVPGLVLAAALLGFTPRGSLGYSPTPLLTEVVLMLTFLNAFNLLPVVPFDGGRLFETLLFARWPALEALFRLLGIAGLAWFAMNGTPLLGVVAAVMLLGLPRNARVAYAARRLRRERAISPDVQALGEHDLVALYRTAEETLVAGTASQRATLLRITIVQLHDRAARRPAPWLPTLGLLLVWVLSLGVAVVEVVWIVLPRHR